MKMAVIHFHLVVLLLGCLSINFASSYYLTGANDVLEDISMDRNKRYTDSQDRASAFCTGMCMYEKKQPYSNCYDLCNWNGRGPSPWAKFDEADKNAPSVSNVGSLMRSGAGLQKARPTKPRRKISKNSWDAERRR